MGHWEFKVRCNEVFQQIVREVPEDEQGTVDESLMIAVVDGLARCAIEHRYPHRPQLVLTSTMRHKVLVLDPEGLSSFFVPEYAGG